MSYILDALKRADAERGQRAPSGLPPAAQPPVAPSPSAASRVKRWSMGVALLALLGAGVWTWQAQRPSASERTAAAPKQQPQRPAEPGPTPSASPPVPETVPTATAPSPALGVPQDQPSEATGPGAQATAPVPPILAQAPPPLSPVKSRPPAAATTVQPAPTVPAPATQGPVPDTAQAQIAVSGSSYSTNPELRMLIVNGQVLKEGQALSPGLTLEIIGPHSAVFNQNGARFNVNY